MREDLEIIGAFRIGGAIVRFIAPAKFSPPLLYTLDIFKFILTNKPKVYESMLHVFDESSNHATVGIVDALDMVAGAVSSGDLPIEIAKEFYARSSEILEATKFRWLA